MSELQRFTTEYVELEDRIRLSGETARRNWLVHAVDVTAGEEALRLAFRGAEAARVELTLQPQALRQWLGILHAQCRVAEWPLEAWPSWLSGPIAGGAPHVQMLH